jgi:hypothetical protein
LNGIPIRRLLRPAICRSLTTAEPENRSITTAIKPAGQSRFALPSRRSISTTSTSNRRTPVCDEASLGRFISMEFARKIYQAGAERIVARDPHLPPTELGLLAIIAYTSGPLHQKIAEYEGPYRSTRPRAEMDRLAQWKALIADTILRIEKTPVPVVRRNTQLASDDLAAYVAGVTIHVDRLTSVTCAGRQVYTGGNADFVIHTRGGVVSVAPLSAYAGSEAEGMLDPGSCYQVAEVIAGKENGRPSLDELSYPARTIILHEL